MKEYKKKFKAELFKQIMVFEKREINKLKPEVLE